MFSRNVLWAYGRRHMLIVELDYELKQNESIFSGRSGIFEQHRKHLIQPEITIGKGMFTRERNITQALIKNNGISAAREETKESK